MVGHANTSPRRLHICSDQSLWLVQELMKRGMSGLESKLVWDGNNSSREVTCALNSMTPPGSGKICVRSTHARRDLIVFRSAVNIFIKKPVYIQYCKITRLVL